jgi:hypothetical protein
MKLAPAVKSALSRSFGLLGYEVRRRSSKSEPHYLERDSDYADTLRMVRDFTMTSPERIAALIDGTRYVVRTGIAGAIVECGVWRGGSMMAVARTLLALGEVRDLYLFDTFAGMTRPGALDVDVSGARAETNYVQSANGDHNRWCYASLEEVQANIASTGYPRDRCHFVRGDVMTTLPHHDLGAVALLRLDTDWYDSTLHELRVLYPKLSEKGVLIIDDYGHWEGCKRAVHEFFGNDGPLLAAVDSTGRIAVKM